jgi:histidinol-phosphate/aromatic aminotransferase/cobyric acid decarboxylase-like protein
VTQLSVDLARIALEDETFLNQSRLKVVAERQEVFAELASLKHLMAIPTSTSIFMLKHRILSGADLRSSFEQKGIIASEIDISGIKGKGYLRFTLRKPEDNRYLCRICKDIEAHSREHEIDLAQICKEITQGLG